VPEDLAILGPFDGARAATSARARYGETVSVVIEQLFALPSVRAFRWTALGPHTGMKESYAVGRLERGSASVVTRGRTTDAGPRSLHVRQPGDVHRDLGRDAPVTLTVVSFAARLVDDAIGPVRLAPLVEARDPRGAALHRLLDAAIAGAAGLGRDVAIAEAVAALAPLDGPCLHTRAVRRARALLRERLADAVSLDELAAHAGLDKFRLCRAFRAEVGLPPHAWLTALRVLRAKELLAAGTAPREVAPLVGFYDQSRLNHHFRRIVGTTPGRYARAAHA
jgi:AraC-like DNA-binding protein